MSNTAASKAATVASRIAGQAATIGAHGVPIGPLVEGVVNQFLGELLSIQDEQLAALRNIERGMSRLVEGPYRTAGQMLERAKIPGRHPDVVKADLQRAADEFLRAAAHYGDATLPQASAYMEASLILGLLGDLPAMQHYGDKAWKESVAALEDAAREANSLLFRSTQKLRNRPGFSSIENKTKHAYWNLGWLVGKKDLALRSLEKRRPEVEAMFRVRDIQRQVDVYRDVAANLSHGPDVLPHFEMVVERTEIKGLFNPVPSRVKIDQVYLWEQIENRHHEFASLVRKLGINEHLYALCRPNDYYPRMPQDPPKETLFWALGFENLSSTDPRVARFAAEVKQMFPYGLHISDHSPHHRRRVS